MSFYQIHMIHDDAQPIETCGVCTGRVHESRISRRPMHMSCVSSNRRRFARMSARYRSTFGASESGAWPSCTDALGDDIFALTFSVYTTSLRVFFFFSIKYNVLSASLDCSTFFSRFHVTHHCVQ